MTTRTLDGDTIHSRFDDWTIYEGVRTRRVLAFVIDYSIVVLLMIPVAIVIALVGIATLGLGWLLYGIMFPAVALGYVWSTLGGPNQATIGMQLCGIQLERLDGRRIDGLLAVVHSVLFWAGNALLTPLVLLASLVLDRKRTVHDLLLGTVVTRVRGSGSDR